MSLSPSSHTCAPEYRQLEAPDKKRGRDATGLAHRLVPASCLLAIEVCSGRGDVGELVFRGIYRIPPARVKTSHRLVFIHFLT